MGVEIIGGQARWSTEAVTCDVIPAGELRQGMGGPGAVSPDARPAQGVWQGKALSHW